MTRDEITDTVKSTAASLASSLREGGQTAFADVRHRATEAARAGAMGRAESAKDTLVQEGGRLAQTLRQAADGGEDSIQARVMGVVADSVDDLTASLRNRDLGDLLGDAEAFARRNPGAFVAAAALAGFAVARFARASTPAPDYDSGYDSAMPAVSQGYSTMPPGSDVESYGSPRPTGSGYGSGEGSSFGTPSYASASVSTHGMTTGGDDTGAEAMTADTMGGTGSSGMGSSGMGSSGMGTSGMSGSDMDTPELGTSTDDDLSDEDTPSSGSPRSTGIPT